MQKLFYLFLSVAIIPFLANAQIDSAKIKDNISYKNDSFYKKGFKAAELNYKGFKTISTITFASSATFLALGPFVAGTALLTAPNLKNINDPLLNEPNYYKGYLDNAKSIRRRKVVKNWLIGTGVCVGLYTIIGVAIISNGNFIK